LRGEYAGEPPVAEREQLIALADGVRLVQDFTQWVDLKSGSRRLGRTTPAGGFGGLATYKQDNATFPNCPPRTGLYSSSKLVTNQRGCYICIRPNQSFAPCETDGKGDMFMIGNALGPSDLAWFV